MTINVPIENAGLYYLNGMELVYATTTTLTVLEGACRDSTNVNDIIAPSNITINTAVQGINGLDQGTLAASTGYSVFAMGDSTMNNPAGAVLSLGTSAPTAFPHGYDMYRLIGHQLTDGSAHLLPGIQTGRGQARIWTFDTLISLVAAGAATSFTSVPCGAFIPAGTAGRVFLQVNLTPAAAGHTVNLRRLGSSDATGSAYLSGQVASVVADSQMEVPVDSTANFQYKVSNGSDAVTILLSAYEDQL